MWIPILTAAQTTSARFKAAGDQIQIYVEDHQGGTWTLQVLTHAGNWLDTDVTFDNDSLVSIDAEYGLEYRLTGGNAGALAAGANIMGVVNP